MICPKCKHKQENIVECESCGAIFERCYKIVLNRKLNEAVSLYNENKYDKSLEIFKYIQRANFYKDEQLSNISLEYIEKIQCNVDDLKKQSATETKDVEIKKKEEEKRGEEEVDNKKEILYTTEIIHMLKSNMQAASYISIILLFVLFLYLRFEYNKKIEKLSEDYNEKIKKISGLIEKTSNATVSGLANITKESLVAVAEQVETNRERINRLENVVKDMIPMVENSNRHSHNHSSYSDMRLKKNIYKTTNGLEKVLAINSYSFNYTNNSEISFDQNIHYGYIAQEVEHIIPELVSTDRFGYKKINYIEMIPILSNAIREQNDNIDMIQKELTKLKSTANVNKLNKKTAEKKSAVIFN